MESPALILATEAPSFCAVFLRLLYVAVHKYGAAAAKVNRFIGKKAYFGKVFCAVTENAGKSL